MQNPFKKLLKKAGPFFRNYLSSEQLEVLKEKDKERKRGQQVDLHSEKHRVLREKEKERKRVKDERTQLCLI